MAKTQRLFRSIKPYLVWGMPLILAFFVVAGGASAPGLSVHLLLKAVGLIILLASLWTGGSFGIPGAARPFLALAGAWICLVGLQLVPLPGGMRQFLPGGHDIARGFSILGEKTPSLPISLTPGQTLAGLFMVIPPLAIFLLSLRMSWRGLTDKLPLAISGLGILTIALGILQLAEGPQSSAYFYSITNSGSPVGVFSNINHQGMFLLMTLPFVGAVLGRARSTWNSGDRDVGPLFLLGTLGVVIVVGVVLVGSLASYALLLPTLLLTLTLIIGRRRFAGLRWRITVPAVFLLGFIGTLLGAQPLLDAFGLSTGLGEADSGLSRATIWANSTHLLGDYWLVGTGLGAFPEVFPIYDRTTEITEVYANHVHNDYLEWLIEFGIMGGALLVIFFLFAARETVRVWRLQGGHEVRIKRAASIAFWLPFMHSFVDYPLRTPAIACFAAVCLAIMIMPANREVRVRKEMKSGTKPERMSRQVEI
ncbi:O-antigen ligase family protein [Parvularcula marina]|uniref:O-antigen ligase family protein n=1 Tax=Parvularcula marina TaxID=2292771 RepID=A0A371RGB3_9PROT|nr:O-antigen ligase family protein [Parvularcula marina]RFB04488.1 O-antigen ligase family protein [Parvularcula marina]